jgi:hypothetical protein
MLSTRVRHPQPNHVIQNPWVDLPARAPFVLPDDRPFVEAFNSSAPSSLRIRTELLPEPFLGNPEAPVVLLALNPGWGPADAAWHRRPTFRRRVFACLRHDPSESPFYHLDPTHDSPGRRWWTKNLRHLVSEVGEYALARQLICVEYFPYHSLAFGHDTLRLPSQAYGFQLVRRAVARGAVILQLRGRRLWEGAVPELVRYRGRHITQTARSAAVSPANCPVGYRVAARRLRAAIA